MKASLRLEMALKEYQLLEEAVGAANTAAYAVAAIFMGGLFIASARLIPEIAQENRVPQLIGYFIASAAILSCTWFWFKGIHLRWRTLNLITYHRLLELEKQLPFKVHGRIDDFYKKSERKEASWEKDNKPPPPWYKELMKETPRCLRPCGPSMNTWWCRIIWAVTIAYIIAWLFPIGRWVTACPYTQSFLQCLSGSTP